MYYIIPKINWVQRIRTGIISYLLCAAVANFAFAQQKPDGKADELRAAARLELATAYYSQRQYGAALVEVKQALALSPKYLQAQNMLGLVETALGHQMEAEAAFKTALSMDPRDPDTHNNYAIFLCQTNRPEIAYTHFETAANNPMYVTPEKAFYNAGRCARVSEDSAKALSYFNSALRSAPRATAVMFELADIQYQQKNFNAVLDVIDRIEAIEGQTPQTLWLALKTEYQLGHGNEVASYGSQLINKFPDSAEAVLYRAKSFD